MTRFLARIRQYSANTAAGLCWMVAMLWSLSCVSAPAGFVAMRPIANPWSMVWLSETRADNKQIVDVNDETFRLLRQQLTTLAVTEQSVAAAQLPRLLAKEPTACTGNLIPLAERRQWGLFSQMPQVVFPGLRLFVQPQSTLDQALQQLVKQQQRPSIALTQVLQSTLRFQLGVSFGRSYGPDLDPLLTHPAFAAKIWQRRASDTASGVLSMLAKGRIDAVIEYPNVVAHYSAQLQNTIPFHSYAIDESPEVLYGHLVCADSSQGRMLMAQFDKVMPHLVQQRAYLDAHLRWFPAELQPTMLALYNRTYGTAFQLKPQ